MSSRASLALIQCSEGARGFTAWRESFLLVVSTFWRKAILPFACTASDSKTYKVLCILRTLEWLADQGVKAGCYLLSCSVYYIRQ